MCRNHLSLILLVLISCLIQPDQIVAQTGSDNDLSKAVSGLKLRATIIDKEILNTPTTNVFEILKTLSFNIP